MGLVFGTTDLETTYGFQIIPNGVDVPGARYNPVVVKIPGKHGVVGIDHVAQPRRITISGIIQGTSQSDLQSKIEGLSDELAAGIATQPTSDQTSGYTEKNLQIPGFTRKFPCVYESMEVEYIGSRMAPGVKVARVTLTFYQSIPKTVP